MAWTKKRKNGQIVIGGGALFAFAGKRRPFFIAQEKNDGFRTKITFWKAEGRF